MEKKKIRWIAFIVVVVLFFSFFIGILLYVSTIGFEPYGKILVMLLALISVILGIVLIAERILRKKPKTVWFDIISIASAVSWAIGIIAYFMGNYLLLAVAFGTWGILLFIVVVYQTFIQK